jgi:hypothetical protein
MESKFTQKQILFGSIAAFILIIAFISIIVEFHSFSPSYGGTPPGGPGADMVMHQPMSNSSQQSGHMPFPPGDDHSPFPPGVDPHSVRQPSGNQPPTKPPR